MKTLRNLFTAVLLLCYVAVWAQDVYTTLPKEVNVPSSDNSPWTSEVLRFEEPVNGIRVTYFETYNATIYNGNNRPMVALSELSIIDADGDSVGYSVTTNSLELSEGSLEALYDTNSATFYHSVWKEGTLLDNGYVYLELTFERPLSEFRYSQRKRESGTLYPKYLSFSNIGETVSKTSFVMGENVSGVIDEETGVFIVSGEGDIASGITLPKAFIKKVLIEEGVTGIGNSVFSGCSNLMNVEIPNSVTSIGESAFSGCSGLTGIIIPNSVTSIADYAFNGCTSLKDLRIEDGTETLSLGYNSSKKGLFYDCPLETLYLGRNLSYNMTASYGYSPFYYTTLTSVVIGNSVTSIGDYAFYVCFSLSSVVIGNSVTSIGKNAFENCAMNIIEFEAEVPARLYSNAFDDDAILAVTCSSVDEYKTVWSYYSGQIANKDYVIVDVEVEAKETTSGIMEAVGIENVASIAKLTVKGSINSYDVIEFRDKMPLLRELDLSEATVVASDKSFNGDCTGDNNLGNYVFEGLSNLYIVKLPKDLVSIGRMAFSGCYSLESIEIPNGVTSIGDWAFDDCYSLSNIEIPKVVTSIGNSAFHNCRSLQEIVIPEGIKSLNNADGSSGFFKGCYSLEKVTLPNGLLAIGDRAFYDCQTLKEIKLPPTVKTIGDEAFYNCSVLEEIRIPSSVVSIGSGAFGVCDNLNKVYTYAVEPTAIGENTFSSFQTATLYVPSFSFNNYYWDSGWRRFLNIEEFDEPYEYFYVNNDYILNDDTGYIEGVDGNAPDVDINAGGSLVVEGEQGDDEEPNQNFGNVNVGSDGEGTSGSIIGDNNLHIDNLNIRITVKGGRWYFFAFPFDIKLKDISMQNGSDYVFRRYDGEERANNGNGGWKDVNESYLKAARGYIFQCSANDVLVLSIKDVKFKKEDKYNELVAHVTENLKDASWNFVGNPYLSYYDLSDLGYSAPITVWDGEKYVAIRPGDDDYHFAPYSAFFVQKPEGEDYVVFDGDKQMTLNQSNNKKEKLAAARRARDIDTERLLINLVLGNGTGDDRTRVVFNEHQSLAYETACDATKFSTAGVVQLYTIGSDKVHYAINERPADNGVVMLGYTAPTAGFYTIEAQRMDAEVFVKDYKTGTLHNLKEGAYSFSTDAGTFNERFEILLAGTAPGTTGIEEVKGEDSNVQGEIYDLQGRKMNAAGKGIYIVNGEKVVK